MWIYERKINPHEPTYDRVFSFLSDNVVAVSLSFFGRAIPKDIPAEKFSLGCTVFLTNQCNATGSLCSSVRRQTKLVSWKETAAQVTGGSTSV